MVLAILKAKTEEDRLRLEFRDELQPPDITPVKKNFPGMDGSTQVKGRRMVASSRPAYSTKEDCQKKQNQKQTTTTKQM